jgi:hypothetical protein
VFDFLPTTHRDSGRILYPFSGSTLLNVNVRSLLTCRAVTKAVANNAIHLFLSSTFFENCSLISRYIFNSSSSARNRSRALSSTGIGNSLKRSQLWNIRASSADSTQSVPPNRGLILSSDDLRSLHIRCNRFFSRCTDPERWRCLNVGRNNLEDR